MKKIKEDAKSVTMSHPKGHTMVILLKGIPLIQREALKRLPLAEGGEVKLKTKAKEEKMPHYDAGTPDQPVSEADVPSAPLPDNKATIPMAQPEQSPSTSNQSITGNNDVDQAKAYDLYGKALNTYNANVDATKNGLIQATNGLNEYQAKNPIDADQYRKNMTPGDKVSTGIGLFLGGFSVPFGGQNFAQDFLNKQISNNIDAQKQNFENKKTVWGAYQALYHDNNVADNLTRINELDKMQNRIKQAAVAPGMPPQAQGNAAKLLQDTDTQKQAILDQTAHHIAQTKAGAPPPTPPPSTHDELQVWKNNISPWAGIESLMKNSSNAASKIMGESAPAPNPEDQAEVPDTGPMPQFQIDEKRLNNSQYLGSLPNPPPNTIQPGEATAANDELAKAKQFNEKIPLIHSNFDTMWKNRSDANAALQYLSGLGANIGGAHLSLPDMTTWNENSKNYYRAANRIRQELGALVGNGSLTNEQAQTVMTNLIRKGDTPEDYKNILHQVDGNLLSTLQTPVLERRGLIKRPKIAE